MLPLQAATPDTKIPAAGPGQAAIASAYPLASEAGKQILAKGGNAFDAAVAVAAALAVVESSSSGLGGGGFFLLRRASDGLETMIDLREMAPGAATRDMYPRQGRQCRRESVARLGAGRGHSRRAGRPGLPGEEVRQVAAVGEHGAGHQAGARWVSRCTRACAAACQFKKNAFLKTPDAARVFLVNGEVPALGYIIKQPELADSLELLATQGRRRFLQGRVREEARRRRAPARRQLDRSGPG